MKIVIFLFLTCFASFTFAAQRDTSDPALVAEYNIQKINPGDGKTFPQKGDNAHVHYEGTLLDGKEFDSSYKRNQPFRFQVGMGHVIQCWDEVVSSLSVGEEVMVTCPSEKAYGPRGIGGVIPPNAKLNFKIKMLSIDSTNRQDL